jgi:hypothetical protein
MHPFRVTGVSPMGKATDVVRSQPLLLSNLVLLDASKKLLGFLVGGKPVLISVSKETVQR